MARIRSIYPEACRSRKLAALTPAAERCWWRLQVHLDDEGRAEDEPDTFASLLFQVMRDVTPGMVDRWLWEMAEAGLIDRYEVNGTNYLAVVRWSDFQHPQKPKRSPIPPAQSASTRRVRDSSATAPTLFADGGDGMGEETDTETEGESEGEPELAHPAASPVDNPTPFRERLAQIEASPPAPFGHLTIVAGEPA
jgi:hypothetical protein